MFIQNRHYARVELFLTPLIILQAGISWKNQCTSFLPRAVSARGANRIIENSKKQSYWPRSNCFSKETFSIWVITTHNLPACAAPGLWLMAPLYTPNNNYRCMARLKFIHFICILLSHKLHDSAASLYSVTTTIWKYSPTFTWAINLRVVQLHAYVFVFIYVSMERCVSYINMRELHALVCESACPTRPCLCVSLSFSLSHPTAYYFINKGHAR